MRTPQTPKQLQREAKKLQPDSTEYAGHFDTLAEFARRTSIDCGDYRESTPSYIDDNIDWEAVGERLLLHDFQSEDGLITTHYYHVK